MNQINQIIYSSVFYYSINSNKAVCKMHCDIKNRHEAF